MANEITLNIQLRLQNPAGTSTGLQQTITQNRSLTQSVAGVAGDTVTVPTTAAGTSYTLSTLATVGYAYLQNLDATNYVQFGTIQGGVFYPVGRLLAGEIACLRLDSGNTFAMRANTASVQVYYCVLNN